MAKYKSKYYLKKEISFIMMSLYQINKSFQLFKNLKTGENLKYICKNFPDMMQIVLNALRYKSFMGLSTLVCDNDDKSISIKDIIKWYNCNKEFFKEKKYYYIKEWNTGKRIRRYFDEKSIEAYMQKLVNDLKDNNNICSYLNKYRNKSMAHNDKKYTYDRRIKYSKESVFYDQIDKFIELLIKDINDIYNCVFGTTYVFIYDELQELKEMCKILKNESLKIY